MAIGLGSFASSRLVVLHEADSAYSAARAMKDNNVGCVLVCDRSGHLTGILTDRDLVVRSICEGIDPGMVQVRYLMTPDPAVISEDKSLSDVVWLMKSLGIRRVPIVAKHKDALTPSKPIGIVTFDDVVQKINGEVKVSDVGAVIQKQLTQQTRLSPEGDGRQKMGFTSGLYSVSTEVFHEMLEDDQGRHKARADQSLGKMLHLARQCLEEHGVFALDRENIFEGLRTFLQFLVRRVVPGAAMNFIAQLPSHFQEELYCAPAGPDKSLNLLLLERAVRKSMRLKTDQTREALVALAETLMFAISRGEIDALRSQLPLDMKEIFDLAKIEDLPQAAV
jgi:CBS domain-containing protein/uncharacterized protein (DUF2267 family)